MDPLTNGLIIREVPVQRDTMTTLPVLLAAGCIRCGAPRGEQTYVGTFLNDGSFFAVPGWSNPCGHEDSKDSAIAESISLIGHLLHPHVGNLYVRTLAQHYIDTASEHYVPSVSRGPRISHRVGAK